VTLTVALGDFDAILLMLLIIVITDVSECLDSGSQSHPSLLGPNRKIEQARKFDTASEGQQHGRKYFKQPETRQSELDILLFGELREFWVLRLRFQLSVDL